MMLGQAGCELEKDKWNILLFGVNLGKVLNYVLREGRDNVTNGRVEASGLELNLGLWAPSPHHCFSF